MPPWTESTVRTLEWSEHSELAQEVEVPELLFLPKRKSLEDRKELQVELLPRDVAAPLT